MDSDNNNKLQGNNTFVTTMNAVTDQLKRNLFERHAKTESKTSSHDHHSAHSEQKFMQHFETINKVSPTGALVAVVDSYEQKFQQTLVEYSSKNSKIDQIMGVIEDTLQIQPFSQNLVSAPTISKLKQSSYDEIKNINEMFEGQLQKENVEVYNNTLLVVEVFSEALKEIGRKNRAHENQLLARSKIIAKDHTYNEFLMKEIQTDPQEFELMRHESQPKVMKRKDAILMELLREKKKKAYGVEYFNAMEMKLMELLEFILQDEVLYIGLDPQSKIKLVLKHLESFQGRTIEGESKINLLRIFFEEFTSLKKQKDELQALKTPMRKVENKQRHGTTSTKIKESRQMHTPQRKQTKGRREMNVTWIENEKIEKKHKKHSAKGDEWIGSMK